jgi:hypothetical protein
MPAKIEQVLWNFLNLAVQGNLSQKDSVRREKITDKFRPRENV